MLFLACYVYSQDLVFTWIIRQTPITSANTISELYLDYSSNDSLPILLKVFKFQERFTVTGPFTVEAVRTFQEQKGLPSTGIVDESTFTLLIQE